MLDLDGSVEVVLPSADYRARKVKPDNAAQVGQLVAVWDGAPSDGTGGTGDVVLAARERGLPVTVVWPDGAVRG